jgi:apoptosis-inducing factor 2
VLRVLVTSEGNLENLALTPYDKLFKPNRAGEVIFGSVEKLEDGVVTLGGGRRIHYDWLVLATGSIWEGPLAFPPDRQEAQKWILDWRTKIASAKKIAIVGGGAVGIGEITRICYPFMDLTYDHKLELAGELHHFHPEINITLVHGGDNLFTDVYPNKFRQRVLDALHSRRINVILGDRVEAPPQSLDPAVITTAKGVTIEADIVVRIT